MDDPNWNHVRIVAALNCVLGGMHLVALLMVLYNLSRGNAIGSDTLTRALMAALTVFSVPYIVIGIGLFLRRRWAMLAAKFCDPILVLEFPTGSPLGLYAIWLFWFRKPESVFTQRPSLRVYSNDGPEQG